MLRLKAVEMVEIREREKGRSEKNVVIGSRGRWRRP